MKRRYRVYYTNKSGKETSAIVLAEDAYKAEDIVSKRSSFWRFSGSRTQAVIR